MIAQRRRRTRDDSRLRTSRTLDRALGGGWQARTLVDSPNGRPTVSFVRHAACIAVAAVLTTYRKDGTALVSPVWFRRHESAFEVVIAEDDIKLRHLARDSRCALVVFEAVPPFRGVEVRGVAQLIDCDVTPLRVEIAGRYLGADAGARFAAQRLDKPGVLLRIAAESTRVWDLSGILPR